MRKTSTGVTIIENLKWLRGSTFLTVWLEPGKKHTQHDKKLWEFCWWETSNATLSEINRKDRTCAGRRRISMHTEQRWRKPSKNEISSPVHNVLCSTHTRLLQEKLWEQPITLTEAKKYKFKKQKKIGEENKKITVKKKSGNTGTEINVLRNEPQHQKSRGSYNEWRAENSIHDWEFITSVTSSGWGCWTYKFGNKM